MLKIGAEKIRALLPAIDASELSPEVFAQSGLFIVRKAIPPAQLEEWQAVWRDFYKTELQAGDHVSRFNPVSIDIDIPPRLAQIHQAPALLDIVESAFGPNLALYNQRFVIKDKYRVGDVFLHSDTPYHVGWPNKASAFVALGPVTPGNGGMYFYPGTHQFGCLGDAGELDASVLPDGWPVVSPSLAAGDVVLMHSATWHGSHPFTDGPDRILVDIIYQPADDPSGTALLRGQWQTELRFGKEMRSKLFKRSRVSRLKELQEKLDALAPKSV